MVVAGHCHACAKTPSNKCSHATDPTYMATNKSARSNHANHGTATTPVAGPGPADVYWKGVSFYYPQFHQRPAGWVTHETGDRIAIQTTHGAGYTQAVLRQQETNPAVYGAYVKVEGRVPPVEWLTLKPVDNGGYTQC
jgi:hypothetical protein